MKEHILESLRSIMMNRHLTKHLLLALKKRRQVQKQIVILQKKTYSSFHACRISAKPRPCNWDSLKICEYDHGSDFSGAWHV